MQLVHGGDREADIFELFALPRQARSELLIRAEQNRKVQHELGDLIAAIPQAPIWGSVTLELGRNPTRPARVAQLQVRAMQVCIEVPAHPPKALGLQPVQLNGILVEETVPPAEGSPPIR